MYKYLKNSFLALLCLASAGVAAAQDADKKHPVEVRLDECLEKNSSTAGMLGCLAAADKEWDAEMNAVYKKLLARSDKPSQEALKAAQRAWITYRDAEYKLIRAHHDQVYREAGGGTIHSLGALSAQVEINKTRALELQSKLDILNNQ